MPVTNKPFPVGLVNRTPATVRQAFWGSPTLKAEFSSAPGSMNITSILTHVIQVVGRFSERFASDVLYDIDRIRELVDCKYDLTGTSTRSSWSPRAGTAWTASPSS